MFDNPLYNNSRLKIAGIENTESTSQGHFTTHCLLLKNIGGHLRGKMMEILTPFENFRSGLEEEVKPGGENMKKNRRESSSN